MLVLKFGSKVTNIVRYNRNDAPHELKNLLAKNADLDKYADKAAELEVWFKNGWKDGHKQTVKLKEYL